MNGDCVALLSSLPCLKSLDASFVDNVKDEHLDFPSNSPLEDLNLLRCEITEIGAKKIAMHCPNLKSLKLGCNLSINNQSLTYIAQGRISSFKIFIFILYFIQNFPF